MIKKIQTKKDRCNPGTRIYKGRPDRSRAPMIKPIRGQLKLAASLDVDMDLHQDKSEEELQKRKSEPIPVKSAIAEDMERFGLSESVKKSKRRQYGTSENTNK